MTTKCSVGYKLPESVVLTWKTTQHHTNTLPPVYRMAEGQFSRDVRCHMKKLFVLRGSTATVDRPFFVTRSHMRLQAVALVCRHVFRIYWVFGIFAPLWAPTSPVGESDGVRRRP